MRFRRLPIRLAAESREGGKAPFEPLADVPRRLFTQPVADNAALSKPVNSAELKIIHLGIQPRTCIEFAQVRRSHPAQPTLRRQESKNDRNERIIAVAYEPIALKTITLKVEDKPGQQRHLPGKRRP